MSNKLILLSSNANKIDTSDSYYFTFNEIFNHRNFYLSFHYLIPTYQRPYDWSDKQIKTLLEDIKKIEEEKMHFLGVMYLGNNVLVRDNEILPIMDGQQRFLTILLLLQALKYNGELPSIFLYDDERNKLNKLFPDFNDDDLDNLGREYKKRISLNKKIIENEIDKLTDAEKNNLRDKVLNNLNMVVVKCTDSVIEREIFQNLNAKGKKLDEIDNIKTHILAEHSNLGLTNFREKWSKINKKGKPSLKKFLSSLQKSLYIDSHVASTPKYEKFVKKISHELIDAFDKTIEQFEWQELDEKDMFDTRGKNDNIWKNYQVCCWFAKKMQWSKKVEGELINNFNKYQNNSHDAIILFLLFFLTFIVDANFQFTGSEKQKLIDDFLNMDFEKRKTKLSCLFKKFRNDAIRKIKFKSDGITNSQDRCLYPLLFFTTVQNGNFNSLWHMLAEHRKIERDHYVPKKPKKIYTPYPDIIQSQVHNYYNLRPLSKSLNGGKSNMMPSEFINDDKSIDWEKIKEYWETTKRDMVANFEAVINKLIK